MNVETAREVLDLVDKWATLLRPAQYRIALEGIAKREGVTSVVNLVREAVTALVPKSGEVQPRRLPTVSVTWRNEDRRGHYLKFNVKDELFLRQFPVDTHLERSPPFKVKGRFMIMMARSDDGSFSVRDTNKGHSYQHIDVPLGDLTVAPSTPRGFIPCDISMIDRDSFVMILPEEYSIGGPLRRIA